MKPSEERRKLINLLIVALEVIQKEKPNERRLRFGDYSREDILRTTYFILKNGSDRFKDLTKEDFKLLDIGVEIEELNKILTGTLSETVSNKLEALAKDFKEFKDSPAGIPETREKRVDLDPQSPVALLRRKLAYYEAEAGKFVEPVVKIPEPKVSASSQGQLENLREQAKANPSEFKKSVDESIRIKRPYTDPGKISEISDVFIEALFVPPVSLAFNATLYKNPESIIPDASKEVQVNVAEVGKKYVEKFGSIKPILVEVFGTEVAEALIPENAMLPREFKEIEKPSDSSTVIKINPEVFNPAYDDNPKLIESVPFEKFFEISEPVETTIAEDVVVPTSYPISLPIVAVVGSEEIAKKGNPEAAVANVAFFVTGIRKKDVEGLTGGLSDGQIHLIKEHLLKLRQAFPGYTPSRTQLGILFGEVKFGNEEVRSILSGGPGAYGNIPQIRGPRRFVWDIAKQAFGGRADRFLDRTIRRNLINKVGGAAVKKLAGTALKSALAAVSNAVPVLGPIITFLATELLSRLLPLIRRFGKWIFAIAAGLIGLAAGGIVGGFILGGGSIVLMGGAGPAVATVSAAFAALGAAFLEALVAPFVIAIVAIPTVIALIMFIINSSAYVVPPSGVVDLSQNPSVAGVGCPTGWPTHPFANERPLTITQGPDGLFDHARFIEEAIDISVTTGHPVLATTPGVAYNRSPFGGYGIYVDLVTTCNGKQITIRYAHLVTVNPKITSSGVSVNANEQLGLSGNTGNSTGPHLHYEFIGGIRMEPPYIPAGILPTRACGLTGSACTTVVN